MSADIIDLEKERERRRLAGALLPLSSLLDLAKRNPWLIVAAVGLALALGISTLERPKDPPS